MPRRYLYMNQDWAMETTVSSSPQTPPEGPYGKIQWGPEKGEERETAACVQQREEDREVMMRRGALALDVRREGEGCSRAMAAHLFLNILASLPRYLLHTHTPLGNIPPSITSSSKGPQLHTLPQTRGCQDTSHLDTVLSHPCPSPPDTRIPNSS